jgi:hypothetical protein
MFQVSLLVRRELIERARDFNIILDDVSITELSFGKEYTAAVEAKQVGMLHCTPLVRSASHLFSERSSSSLFSHIALLHDVCNLLPASFFLQLVIFLIHCTRFSTHGTIISGW